MFDVGEKFSMRVGNFSCVGFLEFEGKFESGRSCRGVGTFGLVRAWDGIDISHVRILRVGAQSFGHGRRYLRCCCVGGYVKAVPWYKAR